MKIIEWNLHFAGDKEIEALPQFVSKYLAKQHADIIVLTEIVKGKVINNLAKVLDADGYSLFFSKCRNTKYANGVCILVKTQMKPILISENIACTDALDTDPDVVHIEVQYNSRKYNVIGNRIRIDTSVYQKEQDFQFRYNQASMLLSYASQYQNVIVIGDQNTGVIDSRDDLDSAFSGCQYLYKGKPREYYNAHLLKEKAKENGFTLKEPQGMNTSVGIEFDGESSRFDNKWKTKIDLAYCSDNIKYTAEYGDDFLRDNQKDYYELSKIDRNGKRVCGHGCPDHAVFTVRVL